MAAPARWEHFAHDADIGVRGIGTTREAALKQAAIALTATITDPALVEPRITITIEREAPDDESLLVEWLLAPSERSVADRSHGSLMHS